MPAFREIARKYRKTFIIADEECSVRGLSGDELAALLGEFPEFEKMFLEGTAGINADAMKKQAPAAIAKFIAIGFSEPKDDLDPADMEEIRSLPLAAQVEMLVPIAELSLPKRIVGPFVRALVGDDVAEPGKAPDTQ